jgi:outer membrane protein assembly factor BamB
MRSWHWLVAIAVLFCGCRPAPEPLEQPASFPEAPRDPVGWPGWRGPNASGVAPGGCRAVRFSPVAGVRWCVDAPGKGASSPVIWDDFVLLTTALADGDPPTLAVLCYRRTDGHLLWKADVGRAVGRTHAKNGYASATVVTDGQRIYSFFGSTGLFCHDMAGKQVWRAELGDLDHQWGTAASPVLYGNMVVQLCDAENDSYLAAFDKLSGRRVWRTARPSCGCWSTPVLVQADAGANHRTELIVNGTSSKVADERLVIAYEPGDGHELWRVRGTTELVTPTILVGDGLVYSTSGRNGPILAIRPGGSGDVTDSHIVWKLNRGGPYIPTGLKLGGRLYVLNDAGVFTCYDAATGKTAWSGRLHGNFTASLVAADRRIYAVDEQGIVYVIAASDHFEILAENPMEDRVLATPAIASGELFLRTESHLYCIPGATVAAKSQVK